MGQNFKIIVTGANGFIGSHICKKLLSMGVEVFGISRNTTRLESIINKIEFCNSDINSISKIYDKISNFNADAIIHCAWDGGNSFLDINNKTQLTNNIPGLFDLLEITKLCKIPHFISIGSGEEYGTQHSFINESTPESPNSLYGITKLFAKTYSMNFCNENLIGWTWIRPIYTYGPDDVESRLIPKTIINLLKKEEIHLDSCNSLVDYLYIDDFVDAVCKLTLGKKHGVFNICSSNVFVIKSIIENIGLLCNSSHLIKFNTIPERNNSPKILIGSNLKVKSEIDWKPKTKLNVGLSHTINFYKNIYGNLDNISQGN